MCARVHVDQKYPTLLLQSVECLRWMEGTCRNWVCNNYWMCGKGAIGWRVLVGIGCVITTGCVGREPLDGGYL